MLLWQEELEKNPQLYSYGTFHRQYTKWVEKKKISQNHKAAEKGFIDYAGTTVPIINHQTGKFVPLKYSSCLWGRLITLTLRPHGRKG